MDPLRLAISLLCLALAFAENLRLNNHEVSQRMHVIERVHGIHAAAVRDEIDRIENRMPRYQTGIPPVEHIVPYDSHPYDEKHRTLQTNNNTSSSNATASDSKFKPIRISFYTGALDNAKTSQNSAKIEWIKTVILPKAAAFWSETLSVVPVSGKLQISAAELDSRMYCGDVEFTKVPASHIANGVADTDLLLYVSASPSTRFCPDRTLAVALPCNFDQFDRPTAGNVNVCLDQINLASDGTASDSLVQDYFDVLRHEMGHVLGESSNSYRFFWDPETGQPRTPRPFSSTTVTCVDGTQRTLTLPAQNTLKFTETSDGRRYADLVTPKVRAVARNQFDCQSMEGARLENQPTSSDSCYGDHWDERLYYPELMSAVMSPTTNYFTSLTLAMMEDTGWYRGNYTNTRMSPFGLGAGCDFVNSLCLTQGSSGTVTPDYSRGFFCSTDGEKGCSTGLTHKLACTILDYSYYVSTEPPQPPYQYFPNKPSFGGPRQADYCPVYSSPYGNKQVQQLDCTNSGNGGSLSLNIYGEVYGESSKCIPSTSGEGRCYQTACVLEDMTFQILVAGKWRVCEYDFQEISLSVAEMGGWPLTLVCPRLSQACPDLFCPFNCAGRGVCNYAATNANGTIKPQCECFDGNDTSPACSDSLIPNGNFLDNASGLRNNVQQNFLNPLIAVFVDHPDTWTAASWAWAAGLVTLCLILLLCICSSFFPSRKGRKRTSF